jgi:hypothetical protein
MNQQVYSIGINYNNIPDPTPSKIRIALLMLNYLLLFVSATGLLMLRKFGLITYYIQFPLRLMAWVFSFGFLTITSEYLNIPGLSQWLLRFVVVLEFFRLYFSIRIHRSWFRTN